MLCGGNDSGSHSPRRSSSLWAMQSQLASTWARVALGRKQARCQARRYVAWISQLRISFGARLNVVPSGSANAVVVVVTCACRPCPVLSVPLPETRCSALIDGAGRATVGSSRSSPRMPMVIRPPRKPNWEIQPCAERGTSVPPIGTSRDVFC
jgi:hypothetical protein